MEWREGKAMEFAGYVLVARAIIEGNCAVGLDGVT